MAQTQVGGGSYGTDTGWGGGGLMAQTQVGGGGLWHRRVVSTVASAMGVFGLFVCQLLQGLTPTSTPIPTSVRTLGQLP
jgi:hypothetical protein